MKLSDFTDWTLPEELHKASEEEVELEMEESKTVAADEGDVTNCGEEISCFDQQVSDCEPASFQQTLQMFGSNVTVQYRIHEPAGDEQCRISFVFLDNPNPEFVDKPLYFTFDTGKSFEQTGRDVMMNCFQGMVDEHNCEGPLMEMF